MFGGKRKEQGVDQEIKTLIGAGTIFEGNITISEGLTRIDGEIVGNITGNGGLIIGESGNVKGDINVESLIVYGRVLGNIKAKSVELKRGSKVSGKLEILELYVEKGAFYNGECRMTEGGTNV
ncbi:polymer-forming cytoskeletal protein [Thermocrinis sp.]|uniref:bactofilin family protein n=1 Tax=Thermocrinis sp. TaxID=2024383 RepID=UPI002FDCCDC2